ncbi:coiled-coil domain-containing protein 73-like [Hypomesus transpacificus]|uniref:coiled-coil domain-containing protein 73-like n=1 Tax=Hypomesus transpacificus TaxID=137520 RepID=UPI001F07B01F|nr:coiled-coil domain-containing protein 73-like [Hypomesus transpacificus]
MNIQMDLAADSPIKPAEVDSGIISLQLLEFQTMLLEAVEELHIHRDAETRNEDQMSKLVLEKQELAWQKESLQRQMETLASQHAEALASVNKQFQIKLRDVEGEKGRYQLSTELKDKETSSLKEELKQLQDQKLQLQSQSRDRHLSQLGEVEKRFGALSRQCALLKQAHAKLEQNVDESMRQNKKLSSLNSRKESTIKALKQSLEELNNKLIKARMSSMGRSENNHTAKDQLLQQLQHRLHVEVMTSLQHTQQLLLAQTQAVCRAEQELRAQTEQHQSLKGEHEVMRARVDAKEDRSLVLEEQSRNARMIWGNEKLELLERIRSEQQDLRCAREAYDSLHHTHAELLSQAALAAEHTRGAQEGVKANQKAAAERGGLSSHSSDVAAEDVFGEKTVDQTVLFQPTQNDRQDKPSDAVSSMESQSADPGRTGEDGRHNEDKPRPQLPRPGSREGLPPPQAGGQPGVTDSLVTETAAVVDVLTRPICGTPGGQPGESNPEPRRNSAQGERRDSHPSVLCRLLDRACGSGDVGSGEGAVWTRLSCSDNRSVYSGAEGSGAAVKGAKDEREEEEGGRERTQTQRRVILTRGR